MTQNIELINSALKSQQRTYRLFLATLIIFSSVILYWTFEPDPLTVNYVKGDNGWSTCSDRRFPLIRDVHSTKDLKVDVKEFWWNIDGVDDIDGKMNEYPHLEQSHYTLSAGTDRVFTFPKYVPKDIEVGRYRYRPHAEYRINPIKVITRDLPIQYVDVVCDYDVEKHGVMK